MSQGRAASYKQTHARILLLSDENWGEGPLKDLETAWVLPVGTATVERVRRLVCRRGGSGGPESPPAVEATPEETGWPGGGPLDSPGRLDASGGTGQLDAAIAG